MRSQRALKLFVPAVDLFALVIAIGLSGHLAVLGVAYALTAMLALDVVPRSRITPEALRGRRMDPVPAGDPLIVLPLLWAQDAPINEVARLGILAVVCVLVGRAVAYAAIRHARARGRIVEPTLIVGSGPIGVQVAETLTRHPEFGLAPVGFLDDDDGRALPFPSWARPRTWSRSPRSTMFGG